MARRIIGLDLGAYSVKLVRLECGKQTPRFEIIDQIEEILPIIENDERDLLTKQKEALAVLSSRGLLEADVVSCAIDASSGQIRIMQTPFNEQRKIEAVLPGLLEAELPFDTADMTLAWHRYEEDSEDPSKKTEEGHVRIAFGKKTAISSMLTLLQEFSVDPRFLHLASVANYEMVRELGFETFSHDPKAASAIIDFGHRSTNMVVFDRHGVKLCRSFMRGGQKLTDEIAKALNITFSEAQNIKHERVNLLNNNDNEPVNQLAQAHYHSLLEDIVRTCISLKTSNHIKVGSVFLVGGGSLAIGLGEYFKSNVQDLDVMVHGSDNFQIEGLRSFSFAQAFSLALAAVQIHAKDSRFNFRKDEFSFRGNWDFLRTKSSPLILWTLIVICMSTVVWSAKSLVLKKESSFIEQQIKSTCNEILGEKNIAPKKCLASMKEQITTSTESSIPDYTASDIYLKTAELLPVELNVIVSEMDISEKKLRLTAEVASFEDVDKVALQINKIPCLVNIEKGSAQKKDDVVKVTFSSDIDCNPKVPAKSASLPKKPAAEPKPKSQP